MHWAARRGDLQMVLVLLDNSGDPNLRETRFGRTPLHEAGMHGHAHVLHEMVKRGADATLKDTFGTSVQHAEIPTQPDPPAVPPGPAQCRHRKLRASPVRMLTNHRRKPNRGWSYGFGVRRPSTEPQNQQGQTDRRREEEGQGGALRALE